MYTHLHDDSNQANENERTANADKKNFVAAEWRRTLKYSRIFRQTITQTLDRHWTDIKTDIETDIKTDIKTDIMTDIKTDI